MLLCVLCTGYNLGRVIILALLFVDDLTVFDGSLRQLALTLSAAMPILAALGIRMSPPKTFLAGSPAAMAAEGAAAKRMTCTALLPDGTYGQLVPTLVPLEDSMKILGVYFSFKGRSEADREALVQQLGKLEVAPAGRWSVMDEKVSRIASGFAASSVAAQPTVRDLVEMVKVLLMAKVCYPLRVAPVHQWTIEKLRARLTSVTLRILGLGHQTGTSSLTTTLVCSFRAHHLGFGVLG